MKRKKSHKHDSVQEIEQKFEPNVNEETETKEQVEEIKAIVQQPKYANPDQKHKKFKPAFARVSVDPTKQYRTPESRESWGPNVKGKKFRKEKGKKKRCPNAGCRIDGAVKSVRLDV